MSDQWPEITLNTKVEKLLRNYKELQDDCHCKQDHTVLYAQMVIDEIKHLPTVSESGDLDRGY